MAGERVLVVDDEAVIVHTCTEILEHEGFVVQGTSTGLEAVERCRQEPFDLLLIDLKLPDIDGLEVLRRGKQLLPDVAAIILTGFGTLDSAIEALRLGAEEYLSKPIESDALVTTIRNVLIQKGESSAMVRGNLRDMSLTSLISISCNEHNQARLLIRHGNEEALLFFEDGNIVHMALNGHEGEEVIYELLAWEQGVFELEQGVVSPKRTVTTCWSALLLRGLQRLDENALGSVEWDGGTDWAEEETGDMVQHLVKDLRRLEGVEGSVIVARDGIVLAHDLEGDAEKEGAVAVFVGNAASQVGETLTLGAFERGVIAIGKKDRMLVLEQPDYYVGLLLGERASPTLVASQAESILK
ncbi:MAG: response regulator [Chloroflexota bacterium]|nr:response regulator [Chloroflexota bacterium]